MASSTPPLLKRAHLLVSGHVQGVFFRQETRRLAAGYGVAGWVRNLADGRVEAVFEGESGAVDRMVEWARRGPRRAWVQSVDVVWEEPAGEVGFRVTV